MKDDKTRLNKIEDFQLNPDKAIFETLDEFSSAITHLLSKLEGVEGVEKLIGKNGTTPVRGEDYYTPEDLDVIEGFILDRLPKEGVDFPSVKDAKAAIKLLVADAVAGIPKPKNGDDGDKGDPGKDGSPDTGKQILAKLKPELKKNGRLSIGHIKGLDKVVNAVRGNSDDIDTLKKEVDKRMVVFTQALEEGSGSIGGGISNIVEDVTPQLGSDLDTNEHNVNLSDGKQYRVKGSDANHALEYDAIADGPSLKGWEGGSLKKVNGGETDVLKWNSDGVEITGNVQVSGNVDGRDVSVDGSKLDTVDTNAQVNLTTEQLQDLIAAMFQGGTHTNASINYDDVTGTIDITASGGVGGSQLTQEEVEDFVGGLTTQGTGISVNYDDAGNILTISLTGESFTTALKNKLDNIEANATADQTGSEIKTAYENEADTNAFTDAEKALLGNASVGKRTMSVLINDSTPITSGDGKAYYSRIPSYLNGWNIVEVAANMVAGTAAVSVQLHNLTQGADILSTLLTIDANEKDSKDAVTAAVIDSAEDNLTTGDRIRIDIDGAGTGTTWLEVQITVQLP